MSQTNDNQGLPPITTSTQPQPQLPNTSTSQATSQEIATALMQQERAKRRGKVTRRVLVAAAGVGLCAGAVELTPLALNKVGQATEADLQNAFSAGIDSGRQALLNELLQLEGISIDGALDVAKITRLAVRYLVLPLANLASLIGGDSLEVLSNAISSARDNLAHVNVHIDWLDQLQTLVSTWHTNVVNLPISLNAYANTDITSAESYLKALKAKIAAEQRGTPAAKP